MWFDPTKHRANARDQQFFGTERFGEVIVSVKF
jgi:hypothetical protein